MSSGSFEAYIKLGIERDGEELPIWVSTSDHYLGVATDECLNCNIESNKVWKNRKANSDAVVDDTYI